MRTPGTAVGIERRSRPWRRLRLAAVVTTASLVLAACDTTDEDGAPADPPAEDGDPEDAEPDATEPDDDSPGDGGADAGAPDDGTDGADEADEADEADGGVEPLPGDPTTERQEEAGTAGTLAVTDVRIGQHDGFDRVVFDLEGDGQAGWFVEYVDEAVEQGRGQTIEVEGDATLQVAIRNVTLPPELPDDIEVWDGERMATPAGGTVLEVVGDSVFEGQHVVFVGTTGESGFLIERFADPQRVVLDIFHG